MPLALVKRVDGDKPRMRDAGLEHKIGQTVLFGPVQGSFHFMLKLIGSGCFVMDALLADRLLDHLHRACLFIAPSPYPDLRHSATAGREQRCMPVGQAPGR